MTTQVAAQLNELEPKTIDSLSEIAQGLKDSVKYHEEAATSVSDPRIATLFKELAEKRQAIFREINSILEAGDRDPVTDSSMLAKVRAIWTSLRSALNSGDAKVVLIEAERAEDVIVHTFEDLLPKLAGSPFNDRMLDHFKEVKEGHDHILRLRNQYQGS